MLFSLRELVQWLGFAPFELLLQGLALLAASVLLVLKVDGGAGGGSSSSSGAAAAGLSWWGVFGPFFAADGLSTYFTAIVSVRLFQDGEKRLAVLRLFWILTLLSLKFVFEMLLCQKLGEQSHELWYGLIMAPVFILLQLLMIRACRVN
nr:transmembrane protein 203 [Pogona vitticeps]